MTTRVPTQSWLPESKLASYGSMYLRMDGRKKKERLDRSKGVYRFYSLY
jgi:hypothetical protein